VTHEQAEAQVREDCRKDCRALLCERNQRCMALLYDTPGFYKRIRALLPPARPASEILPPD
jgi:hypothetical protein